MSAQLQSRLLEWEADTHLGYSERFEKQAEEFYRATGFMAPGKSVPMEMSSTQNEEQRTAAWDEWQVARQQRFRDDMIAAATALDQHAATVRALDVFPAIEDVLAKHCRGRMSERTTRENVAELIDRILTLDTKHVQQLQKAEADREAHAEALKAAQGDAERHMVRANEEIARREQYEIAYTQAQLSRGILLGRCEQAESQVAALTAKVAEARQAMAWVESYYGPAMVEVGCPCAAPYKCPMHALTAEIAQPHETEP